MIALKLARPSLLAGVFLASGFLLDVVVAQPTEFLRSDSNNDSAVDISDGIHSLGYLFSGEPPVLSCEDAADANDDGQLDVADAVYTFNFLFAGGAPPLPPWPDCGVDSTADALDCAKYSHCSPTTLSVISDKPCYLEGENATITVEVPALIEGSLHVLLFEQDEAGQGAVLLDETQPLDRSAAYEFSALLPHAVTYDAMARLLDAKGMELSTAGASLGVRPDLPGIPDEICTFQTTAVDSLAFLDQVEEAVQTESPLLLQMGSEEFLVLLEEHTPRLLSEEVREANPDVLLFRGTVVENADSEVRVSFFGESRAELVEATVDLRGDLSLCYNLEPATVHDPGLPPDLYITYVSYDVRMPSFHDDAEVSLIEEAQRPVEPEGAAASNGYEWRRMRINLYYDNDSRRARFTHLGRIDATFASELDIHLFVTDDRQINTDSYGDGTDFRGSFKADPNTTVDGADVAMLFTNNGSIDYDDLLGHAGYSRDRYAGDSNAYCWVRRSGGTYRIRVAGCHELSHILGACDTGSKHRDEVYRTHWHGWGIFRWPHRHYSIMSSEYKGRDSTDLKWFAEDVVTLRDTVTGTSDHFPCKLSLSSSGQGGIIANPVNFRDMNTVVTLTPIPVAGWRFDGFSGSEDCQDWEIASPSVEACDECEAQFSELVGGTWSPATLWGHDEPPATEAVEISWAPDSSRLVRTSPGYLLRILAADTGSVERTLTGHNGPVRTVAWSPDGTRIASGAADTTVRLWSPSSSTPVRVFTNHTDDVTCLAWSPDSTWVASGSLDNTIRIWNPQNGTLDHTFTNTTFGPLGDVTGLAWSPDSKTLLAITEGDHLIWRFDAQNWQPLVGAFLSPCNTEVSAIAWSPAHRKLVRGCANGSMAFIDFLSRPNQDLPLAGHSGRVTAISWSPDVRQFVSVGEDGYYRRWDASIGQLLEELQLFPPTMTSVAWSPNGRYLAFGAEEDATVFVIELYHDN